MWQPGEGGVEKFDECGCGGLPGARKVCAVQCNFTGEQGSWLWAHKYGICEPTTEGPMQHMCQHTFLNSLKPLPSSHVEYCVATSSLAVINVTNANCSAF